jgi:hypothetical protein
MFGRVLYNGQYQLGKIPLQNDDRGLFIMGANKVEKFTEDFEVLSCSSNPVPPCGTFNLHLTVFETELCILFYIFRYIYVL